VPVHGQAEASAAVPEHYLQRLGRSAGEIVDARDAIIQRLKAEDRTLFTKPDKAARST
jgi:hypothetical protein